MTKKIVLGVGAVVVAGVGYWLISPLFINTVVNEELAGFIEREIDYAISSEQLNLMDQLSEDEMDEYKDEMMKLGMGPEMDEAMPEGKTQVLLSGEIKGVAHRGSGKVYVLSLSSGERILRFEDLDILNGPDLRVLLSPNPNVESSADLGEYIEVGKLKGNIGTQNYILPEDLDISAYNAVVIYCDPFHVVFNAANLYEKNVPENSLKASVTETAVTESPVEEPGTPSVPADTMPQALPLSAADIWGGWQVQSGEFLFSEITFFPDGTYGSFLNGMPFDSGTWSFTDYTISIISDVNNASQLTQVNLVPGKMSGQLSGKPFILVPVQ